MTLVIHNRKLGIGSGVIFFFRVTQKYQTDPEIAKLSEVQMDCDFSPGFGKDRHDRPMLTE